MVDKRDNRLPAVKNSKDDGQPERFDRSWQSSWPRHKPKQMTTIKTDQSGSNNYGNLAARDINQTIHNYPDEYHKNRYMQKLIQKYHEEIENNPNLTYYISEIAHYLRDLDPSPKGLNAKLTDAGRAADYDAAVELKEDFAKKLRNNMFSETAQKIYAFLLGYVLESFRAQIYPLILGGSSNMAIESAISQHVIQPVFSILEENVLEIHHSEIHGMLYYLTGNCHVKWADT